MRSLTINWGNNGQLPEEGFPEYSSLAFLFNAAAIRMGMTQTMTFHGAHILLLLHLLPQLHRLTLTAHFMSDGVIHDFLSDHREVRPAHLPPTAFWLPVGLQAVREIVYDDKWNRTSPLSLMGLFMLPAIRKIHFRIGGNLQQDNISDWQNGRSTVTDFTFEGDGVPESLAGILATPRALTHFSYIEPVDNDQDFDCAAFGRWIVPVRETLQYLSVFIDNWPGVSFRGGHKQQPIGSLRDWPVLRSVRCPIGPLLGIDKGAAVCSLVDVLPRVLSEFTVGMDWHMDDEVIVPRLLDLLGRHQHLARLTLAIPIQERLAIVLRAACGAAGVQLQIVRLEGDQDHQVRGE